MPGKAAAVVAEGAAAEAAAPCSPPFPHPERPSAAARKETRRRLERWSFMVENPLYR